jgi:nicotinamidase-related amidase
MKNCLIITDIQNDFCPGGALAVAEGDRIIPAVNAISARFDKCVATQDWRPLRHVSFASTYGKKPYGVLSLNGLDQVLPWDSSVTIYDLNGCRSIHDRHPAESANLYMAG